MTQTNFIKKDSDTIVSALGVEAKKAAAILAQVSEETINHLLKDLAAALKENAADILAANQNDIAFSNDKNLSPCPD